MDSLAIKVIHLIEKKGIKIEDYELLQYGLIVVFRYVILFALITVISAMLDIFTNCLIFNIFFIYLRVYTGGYHSDNAVVCFFVSAVITIGIPFVISFINLSNTLMLMVLLISLAILFNTNVRNHKNKVISKSEDRVFKIKMKKILVAYSVVILVLLALSYKLESTLILFSIIVNTISVAMENMRKKGEK